MATKKKDAQSVEDVEPKVKVRLLANVKSLGRRGSCHMVEVGRAIAMCDRGLAVEVLPVRKGPDLDGPAEA